MKCSHFKMKSSSMDIFVRVKKSVDRILVEQISKKDSPEGVIWERDVRVLNPKSDEDKKQFEALKAVLKPIERAKYLKQLAAASAYKNEKFDLMKTERSTILQKILNYQKGKNT